MTMRITIEVAADDREDALVLLGAALKTLKKGKEKSGQTEDSCLGALKVTVFEEVLPEPPFVKGDRVFCSKAGRSGATAVVQHSGPLYSGVIFDDGHVQILDNGDLQRERVLGAAPLRFAVGDRVRTLVTVEDVSRTGMRAAGSVGTVEGIDDKDCLVVFQEGPWHRFRAIDLDIVARLPKKVPETTCPCGTAGCPTGPECFRGSDYP